MLPDPIDSISIEDLPNDNLIMLARECGLDMVLKLIRNLPGQAFIVPAHGLKKTIKAAEKNNRKDIIIDDLPTTSWKLIARRCGLDVVLSMFENGKNICVVIPKYPLKKFFHRYIREYFDGNNGMEVALTLGLSRSYFYRLLNEPIKMAKTKVANPDQKSLF